MVGNALVIVLVLHAYIRCGRHLLSGQSRACLPNELQKEKTVFFRLEFSNNVNNSSSYLSFIVSVGALISSGHIDFSVVHVDIIMHRVTSSSYPQRWVTIQLR